MIGLHGLKSWDETLKTHDARAHKTISVARYPVRLSESNNTLQPCCCKPFWGPTKMAPPHEKVFEPNSQLMDLFRRKSRMSQPSPGGAFKLPVMDVPDNPRHRIGSVLRIGRLSRMATFGHARRNPFFQLVASNARNSFTGVIAFLF